MPRGDYPFDYLSNPSIGRPMEEIWKDLQAYTGEFFKDEPQHHSSIDLWLVLPPLWYEGRFVKGLFFSQGVDYLYELYPQLSEIFFSISHSMCWSYSWSERADAYFVGYKNPERESWFRKTHLDRSKKILIPTQDADYINEYYIAPVPALKKDIDVLVVSRLDPTKNLWIIAEAMKVYRQKYSGPPIRMSLITGKDYGAYFKNLVPQEMEQVTLMEEILKNPTDYINFVPKIEYSKISEYYSRAKVCVLASLVEARNRAINEASSCNTPVVCFQALNQYTRGEESIFPQGAGLYAQEFYPECLADTIREVLKNHGDFKPRLGYLKENGRKKLFNTCIDSFSDYYGHAIPDFTPGNHTQNLWLDLALQSNYQLSIPDFIYDKNPTLSHVQGLQPIETTLKFYFSRRDYFLSNKDSSK